MSAIEWTDKVWNPVTGCTKVSAGCKNCYAEGVANRFWGHQYPDVKQEFLNLPSVMRRRQFTDVQCHPERLDQPLRWRKPQRVFVNSMSDLFHENVRWGFIDRVFEHMLRSPRHTFQVLTKRPERMREYMSGVILNQEGLRRQGSSRVWDLGETAAHWPPQNVILCVSVEDQATANERIPLLLQTPAALRGVSYEPGLGPVDFWPWLAATAARENPLGWIIVGGESGPNARPFDVAWAQSTVEECKAAGVPVFVKQMGAKPCSGVLTRAHDNWETDPNALEMKHPKGADMSEWPEDLRVREFPEVAS